MQDGTNSHVIEKMHFKVQMILVLFFEFDLIKSRCIYQKPHKTFYYENKSVFEK